MVRALSRPRKHWLRVMGTSSQPLAALQESGNIIWQKGGSRCASLMYSKLSLSVELSVISEYVATATAHDHAYCIQHSANTNEAGAINVERQAIASLPNRLSYGPDRFAGAETLFRGSASRNSL